MRLFSFVSIISLAFSLTSAKAEMNIAPLAQVIEKRACELSLAKGDVSAFTIVVGLGNAGYEGTRHNIGADLVGHVAKTIGAETHSLPISHLSHKAETPEAAEEYRKFMEAASPVIGEDGLTVTYQVGGDYSVFPLSNEKLKTVLLLQPQFDINGSGDVIGELVKATGLKANQFVVMYDEINLRRNEIRIDTGQDPTNPDRHNGLRSLNEKLGDVNYFRIAIGVSNPSDERKLTDDPALKTMYKKMRRDEWVVGPVPPEDLAKLRENFSLESLLATVRIIRGDERIVL